jgi:type IV pilus assembly protein PilM
MPFKKNLIEHIIRALQIFYASSDYNHIDQLFLVGGLSALQGLVCDIEAAVSVPTKVANVLADMPISKELNCSGLVDVGPAMLLAVGLALRSFD